MKLSSVWRAVMLRNVLTLRRYWFNTLSSLVSLYIFFVLMFFGASAVGGAGFQLSGAQDAVIVGYFIWAVSMHAYSELAWSLTSEAQQGTLEQLNLSPFGFQAVAACNVAANMIVNLGISGLLLLAAMLTTGRWLHINLLSLLPVLVLTMATAAGIGFAIGGLALVYKRVQSFFQMLQFAFIAFLALPWDQFPWARYLPLSMGNHLTREIMSSGLQLWELDSADLGTLAATTLIYLTIGLAAFARAERVARERGLLGHY